MSDDIVEIEEDEEDGNDEEVLEGEGRKLALNLLKHYRNANDSVIVAGVAATSLIGLIIKMTGKREEAIDGFVRAFRSNIDDETEAWENVDDDQCPEPGQSIN